MNFQFKISFRKQESPGQKKTSIQFQGEVITTPPLDINVIALTSYGGYWLMESGGNWVGGWYVRGLYTK